MVLLNCYQLELIGFEYFGIDQNKKSMKQSFQLKLKVLRKESNQPPLLLKIFNAIVEPNTEGTEKTGIQEK